MLQTSKEFLLFDEIISPATVQAMTWLVAPLHVDMLVQIATLAGIDLAKFALPLSVGLSPTLKSPEDHSETFVDVFANMLNLGLHR